ncbi:MAG: 23S rRNA methyltransferase [Candidatus Puniceispirillum sp.]|nr:23S rRNA methyltransferase [Candidatus Puniceispirillum sp.]
MQKRPTFSPKRPALRTPSVRVKTARGRKVSSQRWLQRQLNDPYVLQAKTLGYRSRAAFKLEQLDDKFHFLKKGASVVDLGMAPGGWTQVALERTQVAGKACHVVGIDLLPVDPLPNVTIFQGDFMEEDQREAVRQACGGAADVVLSDMAASTTGHAGTDHLRTVALAEIAYHFAKEVLRPGGSFVAKVFQGGTDQDLLNALKRDFSQVRHFKPPASRKESPEMYVVAIGFRITPTR